MEAAAPLYEQEVDEEYVSEPMQAYRTTEPEDPFHDKQPAQPLTVVALVDVPAMYMNAGDELYLKPTNNHGEAYSEENGLTYEWDFIFHLVRDKNMLEIKQVGDDEPTEPFIEEGLEEGIFTNNKAMVIKYTNRKTEDAIRIAQLGIELDGEHAKLFSAIRKELIELKIWLRERQ